MNDRIKGINNASTYYVLMVFKMIHVMIYAWYGIFYYILKYILHKFVDQQISNNCIYVNF